MRNKPLLSIIIPTYNSEAMVAECILSIVNQSYQDFELLIIDGLSTDNTKKIVNEFSGDNSKITLISESDKGIYDAMNKGVKNSIGDWILFLGSDDRLYNSDVLQKMSKILLSSSDDLVYGNVEVIGDAIWAANGNIYDGEFSKEKLFGKNICHQAIFYRKSLFGKIGTYNTDYKIAADWDLNHRAFAFGKPEYHDQIISYFFAGGESSQMYKNDKFSSEDIVLNLKKYHKIGYFSGLYKNYSWVFYNLAYKYLAERKYRKSFYFLFFGLWHAENKYMMMKSYLYNFLGRNKQLRTN